MNVERFVHLICEQFEFLSDCGNMDSYFMDTPQDRWRSPRLPRRGWTKADIRRREYFINEYVDPSIGPPPGCSVVQAPEGWSKPANRVRTAFRIFDFHGTAEQAAKDAKIECREFPELESLVARIAAMLATHAEWLLWMAGSSDQSLYDIENRWPAEKHEINRILRSKNLLQVSFAESEWQRLRECLTSVDRQRVMDIFRFNLDPMPISFLSWRLDKTDKAMKRFFDHINSESHRRGIRWTIHYDKKLKGWTRRWSG